MSYFGKEFELDLASQEGVSDLLDSLGPQATPEIKQAVLGHKGTVKLLKNGDQYSIISSQPVSNALKEVSFKSGVEFDDEISGNKCKTTSTMDGNQLRTVMKFEDGNTFEIVREFSDSQVITHMKTSTGKAAKRVYKAK